MTDTSHRAPEDVALIALNGAAGLAALAGARYGLGGAPGVPTEWLEGSPFADYRVPGLILGGVYAPATLAAAWAVSRRRRRAPEVALAAGAIQVGWIAAQLRIIGYRHPLQPIMFCVGLADLMLARRLGRRSG
jgi:hypothetical protein